MTSKELSKHLGNYISFDVSELAYLTPPMANDKFTGTHFEGILITNTGTRSHFALKTKYGNIAILDKDIPFIENFAIKSN